MRRLGVIIAAASLAAGAAACEHAHHAATTTQRKVAPKRPQPFVWPAYGFDLARRHAAPPLGLRPPFRTLWTMHGDQSLIEFPPVLEGGRLFLGTNHGLVLAVEAATGRVAWKRQFAGCVAASPAVGNGVVYLGFTDPPPCRGTAPSFLAALDASTGRTLWRFRAGVVETPTLLAGGRVYFGSWDHRVYAVDARTGRLDWSFTTGDRVKGGAAFSGGTIFAGSYDGRLYALDARTGKLRWAASGLGGLYATPSVARGRVFVGSTNGRVYAFAASSGRELWSLSTGSFVYSPVALPAEAPTSARTTTASTPFPRPQAESGGASMREHRSPGRRRCWTASSTSRPADRARPTSRTRGPGARSRSTRELAAWSGASRTASTAP